MTESYGRYSHLEPEEAILEVLVATVRLSASAIANRLRAGGAGRWASRDGVYRVLVRMAEEGTIERYDRRGLQVDAVLLWGRPRG